MFVLALPKLIVIYGAIITWNVLVQVDLEGRCSADAVLHFLAIVGVLGLVLTDVFTVARDVELLHDAVREIPESPCAICLLLRKYL